MVKNLPNTLYLTAIKKQFIDNFDYLKKTKGFNQLTEPQAKKIENELTIEELGDALKRMKNGKSPGIDGFPCEFFKVFWLKLKHFIMRFINNTFTKGQMSTSLRLHV